MELSHAARQVEPYWSLTVFGGWYGFTLTAKNGVTCRFAGRVEAGRGNISDPAMGMAS
ncbi:phospholipase domain-containing protein [Mycetohabitans rhizoxinica]|uniref:phospholipase domain-containing protein n=1 Tax=Mycetohabitans rhizoxinica TaxID=412963 RepID=UPI0030CB3E9D